MKLIIKKGTTSKRIAIFIQSSAVADGSGLTGLVFNSAGLTWYYWREDEGNANATSVTLATATRGTFTSGGFIAKDGTNMPGFYEIGIPNAALATGAGWVVMVLRGAADMAPVTLEIQLVDYDPNDGVRLGLTALPNAAAEAAGGLYTRGTGAGQINQTTNGRVDTDVKALADNSLTPAATHDDFVTELQNGLATAAAVAAVQSDTNDIQTRLPAALVGGKMDAALNAAGLNADAVAEIADGVWDELKADHTVPDSFGDYLDDEVSSVGGGSAPTAAEIADAVWDEAAAGHVAAGSFGEQCGTDIDAILVDTGTTLQAEVDGIQADTEDIQSRLPASLSGGKMRSQVEGIDAGVVNATAAPNLDVAVSSRLASASYTAPPSAASIRAEMDSNSVDLDSIGALVTAIQSDTDDIQTRLPAALVGGKMDAALNAAGLNADAVAEMQAGLATAVNVDDAEAAVLAAVAAVPTANENADALLDRAAAVDGLTPRQTLRVAVSALAGKSSGGASDDTVRAVDDSKPRITATIDANGHRTAVTVDAT